MSRSIKGLPSRVVLRIKDSATGSYPTIARTGDSRTGNYQVGFNDTNTIVFNSRTNPWTTGSSGEISYHGSHTPPITDLTQDSTHWKSGSVVGHYRFEPDAEGLDSSGNGRSLTFVSGTSRLSYPKNTPFPGSKQAIRFPGGLGGNEPLLISADSAFSFGDGSSDDPFSVASWIKIENPEDFNIANRTGPTATDFEWQFYVDSSSGGLSLILWDSTTGNSEGKFTNFSMDKYKGKWIHVACTYDGRGGTGAGQGIKLYINGLEPADTSFGAAGTYVAMEVNGAEFRIGGSTAVSQYTSGSIDELAVFSKELSVGEIRDIMGFQAGVSFPTRLPANSRFLTQHLTTSIFVDGDVVKGVADNYAHFSPGQELTPFTEHDLFEQNQTSDFYLTGSDPVDTTVGFSTPLRSKTQIRLSLPVREPLALSAATASVYHYNIVDDTWERIRSDLDALGGLAGGTLLNVGGMRDGRLFSPFGTPSVSASNETTELPSAGGDTDLFLFGLPEVSTDASTGPSPGIVRLLSVKRGAYVPFTRNGTLIDAKAIQTNDDRYRATSGQAIDLGLQQPFLIEKVVAKIPIAAGPGWFNDKTTIERGTNAYSAGGPVIVFALQNQRRIDRRELILSATIVPSGDDFTEQISTKNGPGTFFYESVPHGYRSFSTPSVVVQEPTSGFFTGSITIEETVRLSNGGVTLGFRTGSSLEFGFQAGSTIPKFFGGDLNQTGSAFVTINPFGRGLTGAASGRSYFGKGYVVPPKDVQPSHITSPTSGSEIIVFNADQGAVSPYLMMPKDRLVVSIYKHRPVHDSSTLSSADVEGGLLTGSHDIQLYSGSMSITLYGSLIRNASEYHNSLNQPLTSDAIHEAILEELVDQHDIEESLAFSGTYVDNIVIGNTLGVRGVVGTGTRRRSDSSNNRQDIGEVTGSLFRNVKLTSPEERFYDTLTPRPDQINKINGGIILAEEDDQSFGYLQVGSGPGWGTGADETRVDTDWYGTFPFEARYSSVVRTRDPFSLVVAQKVRADTGTLPTTSFEITNIGIMKTSPDTLSQDGSKQSTTASLRAVPLTGGFNTSLLSMTKAYYGISTTVPNDAQKEGGVSPANYQYSPKLTFSLGVLNLDNGVIVSAFEVVTRGWKYGLMNGVELKNSSVWRRDRYGNFRDMLEQRRDTKFLVEKTDGSVVGFTAVEASPIKIVFSEIDPEDTFSSNVSLEATSSLPFFDGDRGDEGRNRGPLPIVTVVQFVP
jgi:hypothetical protein